jgi:hypothetical protein
MRDMTVDEWQDYRSQLRDYLNRGERHVEVNVKQIDEPREPDIVWNGQEFWVK